MGIIRNMFLRLLGRQAVPPGVGQRIQEREQADARRRLLQANQARESRWGVR